MHQAHMQLRINSSSNTNPNNILFLISDLKEGFEKKMAMKMNITEYDLPLLLYVDTGSLVRQKPIKFSSEYSCKLKKGEIDYEPGRKFTSHEMLVEMYHGGEKKELMRYRGNSVTKHVKGELDGALRMLNIQDSPIQILDSETSFELFNNQNNTYGAVIFYHNPNSYEHDSGFLEWIKCIDKLHREQSQVIHLPHTYEYFVIDRIQNELSDQVANEHYLKLYPRHYGNWPLNIEFKTMLECDYMKGLMDSWG